MGAGSIGTGIAINAAHHGVHVVLIDTSAAIAERAKRRAAEVFSRFVSNNGMKERERAAALSRIEPSTSIADVTRADVVIESVYESFAVKAAVFDEISRFAQPDALIATNTSGLRVSRLAAHVANPGRFLGLHFFSPAEINPVVELVSAERTTGETADLARALLQATRRVVLPCKDSPGFALNRFFCAYSNEAARLLGERVGTVGEIERAAEDAFDAAAGPFRVLNLIKPGINLDAIRNLAELGAFYAPAPKMVEIGETGGTFEVDRPLAPMDEVQYDTVIRRVRGATFLAVLQELDEEVADARVLDTGAKLAFKFSRPPCALMDSLGRRAVEALVAPFVARYGVAMPVSIALVGRLATDRTMVRDGATRVQGRSAS
ncbi:enoyl-CoA hydratase [Blastochloris viridis]|uniref:Enoyl-CoA hydratase n=1 Tax=Blastochloris viridis TaxID=1079 RepID=A0A182CXZ6_BLAVI|nr:enoyl-CoA hydratase [Blastochloris viridis]